MPSEAEKPKRDYGKFLVEHGWTPDVAGEDFNVAVRILEAMAQSHKGLILSGDYGSGKTSFVRAAFGNFSFYSMPNDEWILTEAQDAIDLIGEDMVLDDIGCEHTENKYGVKIEHFADFIVRRHARKVSSRLIITTNLTTKDFERIYGGRVVSRLKEMCLASHFLGKDKRQWEIVR